MNLEQALPIQENTKQKRPCSFLDEIVYSTKIFQTLTEDELRECAALFSSQYGQYASDIPADHYASGKEGQPIKFTAKMYRKNYFQDDYYISMAHYQGKLIGQAVYVRKKIDDVGTMSWIVQLVVHSDYTNCHIAHNLLHSAWGFSNDVAWGLATSNPLTVKTLESATFRKADVKAMAQHRDKIEKLAQYIPFAKNARIVIDADKSIIDTGFYVDHGKIAENQKRYGEEWTLGELPEGQEWLAFTFQEQSIDFAYNHNRKNFAKMLEFDEAVLKDAYSRMDMGEQGWTRGTAEEIDYILSQEILPEDAVIADFGCGHGRHLQELAQRGYTKLYGLDFSESNIAHATASAKEQGVEKIQFLCADSRSYCLPEPADYILCLYDVIGSYHDEVDNKAILVNIYANLAPHGTAVISVMNMTLTETIAKHRVDDITQNAEALFYLKASNIMQTTGNIFNPEHYLIDDTTKMVYRKEEFTDDGKLSAEYVIRDKRYTMEEIETLALDCGFQIVESRYVRAGAFANALEATDPKAKEILLILKK